MDLRNISKSKWKSKLVKHIRKYANNHCVTKRKNLSKLRYLFEHKQEMIKEKYMYKLSRSETSAFFKLHTRMIHLKNHFRNIYKQYPMPTIQKKTRCGRTYICKVQKTKRIILKT